MAVGENSAIAGRDLTAEGTRVVDTQMSETTITSLEEIK
ncbi:hypothetical protein GcM1_233026 [Golovinomyces cichoracearum]|uniref:Uncharacterized protein n=1 Tax=Golovinomyces cichoracearum TaxID=62708 RepID=A0A420ILZ6_9PEZI|nr:hypothetical protein GcM1_233026 [Golovinomyces cichoracearum]